MTAPIATPAPLPSRTPAITRMRLATRFAWRDASRTDSTAAPHTAPGPGTNRGRLSTTATPNQSKPYAASTRTPAHQRASRVTRRLVTASARCAVATVPVIRLDRGSPIYFGGRRPLRRLAVLSLEHSDGCPTEPSSDVR